jgi:hypothetical protein
LLQTITEMESARTAWQVAKACAVSIGRVLRASAVIVHQHDERTRELRIIGIQGAGADDLLGSIARAEEDFVATMVISSGQPMMVRLDGQSPRTLAKRFGVLGASRSIMAVPIIGPHGCVGLIEVVDVDDRRTKSTTDVCELVAEPLLRFLGAIGGPRRVSVFQ